jgi:tetratricopeptide (TPR) repeat protein
MIAKWFVAGALAILVVTCLGAAQSVPELLEKGIYTQETVGNLDAAIEIYRQILSSAPVDRTYAAQVQYRLAQCLLQKGKQADAARAFKKVIEGYPEQKDLVEKARENLLPLAHYLEADYNDPVLGFSFSSPEWPVSHVTRFDDGAVEILLYARYDGHRFPHRVDYPGVCARRSAYPSVKAFFEEFQGTQCRSHGCRALSTREFKGWQVLSFVSDSFDNNLNPNMPTVGCGVLIESGKTEASIRALVPAQDLERTQAIIEQILQSMKMP